jgi:CheY-like chemotaxis protein/anti-sigma regulatory factor (Ser/Thr protein kinase)
MRELLTNLIFNAVDALPDGGAINIGTRAVDSAVFLKITDTGTGMTEEVRRRCLEPFFTTKGKRGTGLGLAMVFGIVQRHAGTIEIESKPGEGTSFLIRLPATLAEIAAAPDLVLPSHHPLRILVVDDQPILCQLVCQHLEDDLHVVETALSGSEALEKFRAAPFDLVITDHVMEKMTGDELAVATKALNPRTPVILLTGYAGGSAGEQKYSTAVDLVLRKPLSRAGLRRAFTKVIAAA